LRPFFREAIAILIALTFETWLDAMIAFTCRSIFRVAAPLRTPGYGIG
jgi:hypothetical protein